MSSRQEGAEGGKQSQEGQLRHLVENHLISVVFVAFPGYLTKRMAHNGHFLRSSGCHSRLDTCKHTCRRPRLSGQETVVRFNTGGQAREERSVKTLEEEIGISEISLEARGVGAWK